MQPSAPLVAVRVACDARAIGLEDGLRAVARADCEQERTVYALQRLEPIAWSELSFPPPWSELGARRTVAQLPYFA